MTEIEKKAEEEICNKHCDYHKERNYKYCQSCYRINDYIKGYKQGQKNKLTDKEKLVGTFINVDLEKENEQLKLQLKVAGDRIDSLSSTNIALSNQIEKLGMRRSKRIKPREMTEQEKEIIKEIKKQNIKKYELSRDYTFIKWFDENNNELGFIFNPTGYVIESVIERVKEYERI